MKKTVLICSCFLLFGSLSSYAADGSDVNKINNQTNSSNALPDKSKQDDNSMGQQPTQQPQPTDTKQKNQAVEEPNQQTPAVKAQTNQPIDCSYKVPEDSKNISDAIITKWAKHAVIQSFEFNFNNLDKQIADLETCYTKDGWKSFNDALEKSGNLKAIKNQKLMVSSEVTDKLSVTNDKEKQWKVNTPLTVTYKNSKETLTQKLNVFMLVGIKKDGKLGVAQIIAMPVKDKSKENTNSKETNDKPEEPSS